jgi:DNA-binding MarR family transcriptional regulator
VTVAEWVLMRELYNTTAVAPSRLAQQLGMTRGAITKLADRLINRSLVVRQANRDDRRAQTLALTPMGRSLVPELAALADKNDKEFFGHLTSKEHIMLKRILRDIVKRRGVKSVPVK